MVLLKHYISNTSSLCLIFLSTIVGLLLYVFSPNTYSYPIVVTAFILFILTAVNYFSYKKSNNYFSFEFLFTVAFAFVYFMYPVFVYPVNKYRYFIFALGFNEDVITRATLLALIGYDFFVVGLIMFQKKNKAIAMAPQNYYIPNLIPTIITFAYSVFLLVSAIITETQYSSGNTNPMAFGGLSVYFGILANGVMIVAVAVEFHNLLLKNIKKKWWSHNMLLWIALMMEIISGIISGSRTFAVQIALMVIAGYAVLHGGIRLKQIIILMLCGFCCLSLILVLRSNGIFKFSFNILDMGMDLILTNYPLYLGYDYVQTTGLEPFPLLGSLLSVVPFLLGRVVSLFSIPSSETSSARFFSCLALGDEPSFGLGTNIISSLYLSTGLVGVMVLMFLLGVFISSISINVYKASLYRKVLFFSMIGFSVYLVRSEYFYVASKITYALLFALLLCGRWARRRVSDNRTLLTTHMAVAPCREQPEHDEISSSEYRTE